MSKGKESNSLDSRPTEWAGPRVCDFCRQTIHGILYDARTKSGPWATMCQGDFDIYGVGKLGTGQGQRYEQQGDKFVKVGG